MLSMAYSCISRLLSLEDDRIRANITTERLHVVGLGTHGVEDFSLSTVSPPAPAHSVSGFHASNEEEFAAGFAKALELSAEDTLAMRLRARESSRRFSEEVFAEKWLLHLDELVELERMAPGSKAKKET